MVLPLSCVVTLCCPVVKSFYFLPFGGLSLDMLVQHTYRQFNNSGVPLPTPPSSPLPYPRLVSLTPKFDADI